MSDPSEIPATNSIEEISMDPSPAATTETKDIEDFDILALYENVTPKAPANPSIAQWLVPIYDKHKKRILDLAANSQQGTYSHSLKNSKKDTHMPT